MKEVMKEKMSTQKILNWTREQEDLVEVETQAETLAELETQRLEFPLVSLRLAVERKGLRERGSGQGVGSLVIQKLSATMKLLLLKQARMKEGMEKGLAVPEAGLLQLERQ